MAICPQCEITYDSDNVDHPFCRACGHPLDLGSNGDIQKISSGYTIEAVWGKRKRTDTGKSTDLDNILNAYDTDSEEDSSEGEYFHGSDLSEEPSDSQEAQFLLDVLSSKITVDSGFKPKVKTSDYQLVLLLSGNNTQNPCQDVLTVLREAGIEYIVEKIERK